MLAVLAHELESSRYCLNGATKSRSVSSIGNGLAF